MADWIPYLAAGEILRWEGRPAPRCHTFRYWRCSLAGAVLLILAGGWQGVAVPMGAPHLPLPMLFPLLTVALILLLGLPLWQRLTWETVFYAITDRQLLIARGGKVASTPLPDIVAVRLQPHGEELGTLYVERPSAPPVVLACLEYPRTAAGLLKGHPNSP